MIICLTVLTMFFTRSMVASSKASSPDKNSEQETRVRGYWVDPSTKLMWAGKDNNKEVNWRQATKYCRGLRLAQYSDWRLATIDELQGIYDKGVDAHGLAGSSKNMKYSPWNRHVKGNIFLTGDPWSSSLRDDAPDFAWRFDFNDGRRYREPLSFHIGKDALCVRGSAANLSPPPVNTVTASAQTLMDDPSSSEDTQVRGYWVDPTTRLMWAAKDNGKNLNWYMATKYCNNYRLAGYSDWRLATINELESLIDMKAYDRTRVRDTDYNLFNDILHVNGNLLLTGAEWSSDQRYDDRGHPDGYGWYFDFVNVLPLDDELSFYTGKHALCVRHSRD